MIEDRPESVFVSDISAIEARQNLYSVIYSSLSKINEELASVYNKHKVHPSSTLSPPLFSCILTHLSVLVGPHQHPA